MVGGADQRAFFLEPVPTCTRKVSTPPPSELAEQTVNISGTVSKPPSAVTVNGKPATINGNSWSVLGIPTGGRELRYFDMNVDATVVEEEGGSLRC